MIRFVIQTVLHKRFTWLRQKRHLTAYSPRGAWAANLIIPPFPCRLPGQPHLSNQAHPMPDGMNRGGRELSPPPRSRNPKRKASAQASEGDCWATCATKALLPAEPTGSWNYAGRTRSDRTSLRAAGAASPSRTAGARTETNWAVVKEFERLWWSEAGDEIVERFADKLPMVGRSLWEKNEPDGVGLPRSRTGRRP